jgi:protein ImuB
MVTNSGATPSSESFRPLNPPIPIEVRESAHQTPRLIKVNGRWRRVMSIDDLCNVDEEWWRERPISRMYYRVILEGDRPLTVFRDMVDGAWYRQFA